MKLDLSKKIFKTFNSIETKVADDAPRTLVVKITTSTPDRAKDIVDPKGMNADNFMKNPVVLFAHNYSDMPIAKCTSLKEIENGVLATVQFPEEGMYPKADTVYQMYKKGFLNAWSVGFMPTGEDGYEENEAGGYTFKQWELLEFSSVPVPANAEALTVMRSKGFDVDALFKKEEKKEEIKKDADNPADPGYTDDTKITDLTVGQFKNLIDECLDAEEEENNEGKSAIIPVEKVGRTISAKHEGLLTEAVQHCVKVMDNVNTVLDSVAEEEDDGKSVKPTNVLLRLGRELRGNLKKTDKDIGLALRTLKLFENERGGENK